MNNTENHISEVNNPITSSVVTLPESGDKIQSTETATVSSIAKAGAMAIMIAVSSLATTSCDNTGVDPVKKPPTTVVDLEKQKEWAKAIEPNADGTPKVVTLPPVGNEPFVYKDFMKMELKPVNYANGSFSVTPIFSRKVIEEMLTKAQELEPGKSAYGINLALGKNETFSLTNSITISTKDEEANVASIFLYNLPEYFTFEDIRKLNSIYSNLQATYIVSNTDNLYVRLTTKTIGREFGSIYKTLYPLVLASSGQ